MLEDRPYMRSSGSRNGAPWPMTVVLLALNLVVFIIVEIHAAYDRAGLQNIFQYFALSNDGLAHGKLWQFFTFQFLHGDRWHFLVNMLFLYLFGKSVEESVGKKHFLLLYFGSGVVGGIVQSILGFAFPTVFGAQVVGASAGIFGLVAAFAMLDPNREILVFFVLPMRAKYFLWLASAVAIFYVLVPAEPYIAHGAHLGGILGGVAYVRWIIQMPFSLRIPSRFGPRRRPRQLVKVRPGAAPWLGGKQDDAEELAPDEFISREVDPILDKISAHGIQSLTPREKQILEAARTKMGKR